MILIVGLGNPGRDYIYTRHNIGFIAADCIADELHTTFTKATKFNSDIAESSGALILKPQTYMNLSGRAVQAVSSYYKIDTQRIIVLHDDIDLQQGDVRIKCGGGHAGHNGLKSIDEVIGRDYWRIRFGIGKPNDNIDVADYVLGKLTQPEMIRVNSMISHIANNLTLLMTGKFEELKLTVGK